MILIADNKSFYSLWISAQNIDPDQRIAGGKKAYRGQFPYMVNIEGSFLGDFCLFYKY